MLRDDYLDVIKLAVKNAMFNGVTVEEIAWAANDAIAAANYKIADLNGLIPYPDSLKLVIQTPIEHRQFEDQLHHSERVNMFVTGRVLGNDMHSELHSNGDYVKFQVEGWDSYEKAVYHLGSLPFPIAAKIRSGHRHFAASVILPANNSEELHPVRWEVR